VRWHILASSYFDFEMIEREVRADRSPRHFLRYLSHRLNAPVHLPDRPDDAESPAIIDRILGRLYSQPRLWALARNVRKELEPGDVVYAAGADGGLPLALVCSLFGPRNVRFAVTITDVQRPRVRLIGWILALLRLQWMIIVPHDDMVAIAYRSFGRSAKDVVAINGLTDFDFFRPDDNGNHLRSSAPHRARLIASCGAEARDYQLLADAAAALGNELPVEVKVCFASPNLTSRTRYTMPEPMPDHMDVRYYGFAELRQLYRDADVVVVPLLSNRYAAGLSTVFEAVACGRPVVVANSPGIVADLIEHDLVIGYKPGDVEDLRQAIVKVLSDPAASEFRAERAHHHIRSRHSAGAYFQQVVTALTDAFGQQVSSHTPMRQ
jgi:glycosyltransferase involved in cell wall biosynthesis